VKRKIGLGLLYSGLVVAVIALFGVIHAAAVNYTNQYYVHLFNSLIDNTAIGTTTPNVGRFTNTSVNNNDTTPTGQGMYNQWNLNGTGEGDFITLRGTGAGGFNWYSGSSIAAGTPLMHLGTSTLNVPGITLANAPSNCSVGSASGIDVNGNAVGCSSHGVVMAAVRFTTCTIASNGDTDQGCTSPSQQNWGVTLPDTSYVAQCSLQMADSYVWPDSGSGDALAQSTIATQNLTTTGFKYTLANVHSTAAGFTMTAVCTATHL
jgi:hypothetical protein